MSTQVLKGRAKPQQRNERTVTITLPVSNEFGIVCIEDLFAEAQRHFDVEKNEKNRLYAFLYAFKMMDEYSEFCRTVQSDDWHLTALGYWADSLSEEDSKKLDEILTEAGL